MHWSVGVVFRQRKPAIADVHDQQAAARGARADPISRRGAMWRQHSRPAPPNATLRIGGIAHNARLGPYARLTL
jgi:hypothetical protein